MKNVQIVEIRQKQNEDRLLQQIKQDGYKYRVLTKSDIHTKEEYKVVYYWKEEKIVHYTGRVDGMVCHDVLAGGDASEG